MINVQKLLENKGSEIWSVNPEDTVYRAIEIMEEKQVGALAVLLGEELIGIISERDYARKIILKGRSSKNTLVKDIMTSQIYYTFPQQNIEQCMIVMTENKIRHLPVMLDKKMIGMISLGDVVKEIISEQKYTIEQLEHTISWEESY